MSEENKEVSMEQTIQDKTNGDLATSAPPVVAFDLSKKKKKKKPKAVKEEEEENGIDKVTNGIDAMEVNPTDDSMKSSNEPPADFAPPDFTGKKKKKKKKVVFDDEFDDQMDPGNLGETESSSRREVPPQPWDGTDRDYSYQELISRAFQFQHAKNPTSSSIGTTRQKLTLQAPRVAREGTKKTVFLNFGAICKSIHRQQDHVLQYMSAELGTTGNIQDGGRLVMKGRFNSEGIVKALRRYMGEYVICKSCRSPDTVLMKDATTRLYFVSCESCGARRSVTAIRQGYMAQVERRKRA